MAYVNFKDLSTRTASHKVLFDEAFRPKYDGYQCGLVKWFMNFLTKSLLVVLLRVTGQRT